MNICFQKLLSVLFSEYSVIKGNFNGNRSVPSKFMLDIEYSVITSDVIKSFDCTLYGPHGQKTCLISAFVICLLEHIISRLATSQISIF